MNWAFSKINLLQGHGVLQTHLVFVLKAVREKKIMQVTSILSFSCIVFFFYLIKDKQHLSHLEFVVSKFFQFRLILNFVAWQQVNSIPNKKILDCSKFKAVADDKMNVTQILNFFLGKVKITLEKEENAGHQHFLLSPKCFEKPPFLESLKVGIVW